MALGIENPTSTCRMINPSTTPTPAMKNSNTSRCPSLKLITTAITKTMKNIPKSMKKTTMCLPLLTVQSFKPPVVNLKPQNTNLPTPEKYLTRSPTVILSTV
uniref:Uncharacterized protein n=1 Tax=Cacopsylla melanoneura TaxID=428564 RepID=A0A8D8QKL4_9HEMI